MTKPSDKATGPRGSKLDAQKRADYLSDVGSAAAWDTSAWPTWTVTGRVLPERCDVMIPLREAQGVGAGGRVKFRLEVVRSLVSVLCALEKANPSVFEIADLARSALMFPVDYIAFQNRGAYEIVLDLCINNQTGQAEAIPIFEPIFDAGVVGLSFDPQGDKSKIPLPWEAGRVPELPTALHDLTEAVRYPRRTFEHCRMAVEAVRRHFDPPAIRGHADRWREGEEAMSAALHVTRASLKALDAVAARSRHGELVISMNWEMRKRALELAWELVSRFKDHLLGAPKNHWKVLDIRIES